MKKAFEKYKVLIIAIFILILAFLGFCGASLLNRTQKTSKTVTIGISLPNSTILDRWKNDAKYLESSFKVKGYETILKYAEDNSYDQKAQITEMINSGVKVLLITPVDDYALSSIVEEAKKKGIIVISYDRMIINTDAVDFYVTFKNYDVGRLQARFIVEKLNLDSDDGNKYNIEIFAGDRYDYNSKYYYNGAMSVLKKYLDDGKINILSGQNKFDLCSTDDWNGKIAANRLNTIIDKCYQENSLDAILCGNDALAVGVYEKLIEKGYADNMPVITGQDGDAEYIGYLKDSEKMMTVFKDTRILAQRAVTLVDDLLKEKTPEINNTADYNNGKKRVNTYEEDVLRIDCSNYKELLVDSGYLEADVS